MFVTFEGIDGSGKSTQAGMLSARLEERGLRPLLVREPGGPPLSERIRALLLSHELEIAPFAELLLFSAARAQLVREVIRPALQDGRVVIADRFYDSTTTYQGAGRKVADPEWLEAFHLRVTDGLIPDRTYLIDVPLEVAIHRRSARGQAQAGLDRMEAGSDAFFRQVREAYLDLAARAPERIRVFDGTLPPEQLHALIIADLNGITADLDNGPKE